jgi:hypothetical protein
MENYLHVSERDFAMYCKGKVYPITGHEDPEGE